MTLPAHVAVLGGGRMGAGIAHAFATRGHAVTIIEQDDDAAQGALERVRRYVAASIQRGLAADVNKLMDRVHVTSDIAAAGDADLAIEAVPEDLELKRAMLTRLEASLPERAILATNTSALSISTLAQALTRPRQFLGLHFFNPVPASTLVEIVTHPGLDPDVTACAQDWVEALGKLPITVTDSPGFASSRLGIALAMEAIRMVEEGVASPADIDTAMEQGYKHPMGPLRTTDLVGLDVRLGIAEHLHATLGERFAPPQLLRDMVARGDIGRKSGKGFYDWSTWG